MPDHARLEDIAHVAASLSIAADRNKEPTAAKLANLIADLAAHVLWEQRMSDECPQIHMERLRLDEAAKAKAKV